MSFGSFFTYDLRIKQRFGFSHLKRLLLAPNYRVVVYYRAALHLRKKRLFKLFGKLILVRISRVPGVEFNTIHPIGKGLKIAHAHDIVIGYGSIIKENVTIYNGVTLGAKSNSKLDSNILKNYPTICENVTIFPGAKIIGEIEIGAGSIIGANSVVLRSFEKNTIIAGNPAKKIGSTLRDAY